MKKIISKGFLGSLVIIMLLFSTTFASTENAGIEKQVNGMNVNLTFMSDDVVTGSNDLMIQLHDNNDKPVDNATIRVLADMDRTDDHMDMSDTEPLQTDLEASHEAGQYMGTLEFTDSGEWMIKAYITIDGKESVADFTIAVAEGGPNWYIIGGFLGVITFIIVLAAINKKRKSIRT
ncbi:FixH family protein [Clostridium aminobutyricum]|uniref:FixH family protein n=1 Tax=Clostridium aminobutyricum TaxID=33953 RepID=A0A939D806_CLOAM|nr:FixH family protein [Clostridium aminobutyricum]MBN7772493.1 FixH family protein [Clostridium aminobutyricum]